VNPALIQSEPFLDYEKSLACIHCGLCLSACPTYLESGNENDSPRGRIYLMRAVHDGRLPLERAIVRHFDLCLGCRACEVACPSAVPYGELLEATRSRVESRHRRSVAQRFLRRVAIEQVFPFPWRLRWALLLGQVVKRVVVMAALPRFVREALSLIPDTVPKVALPEMSPATGEARRGRVGLVKGCVASVLFGPTNAATVRLVNQAGYDVTIPKAQGCCGALYAHSGKLEKARACARRNLEAFERLGVEAVITNAAGCGSTLKEYGHLLAGDPAWAERARQFSAKVRDVSEWLSQTGFAVTPFLAPGGPVVTCHDACHLAHAQRVVQPPRELVRAVAGDKLVELPEADVCCGSAGSYNLTEPDMAERLQQRKIDNILQSGARVVVTTNPGCILQIQAGLRKAGAGRVRVLHLVDYLAEASARQAEKS
jgi:glycolate oxidase iron-sulfur subunit